MNQKCYIWNLCGPAETTLQSLFHRVNLLSDIESIPLGKPLPNYHCIFQNDSAQPVTVNQESEVLVSGVGIFAGYLGRDDLTAKALIEINGEVFYRTGDIVRMDKNGVLHYVSRKDFQIKLRGQRIELGEIERCLLKTSISACVVTKWGDDHLIAYIQSCDINGEQLRQHCQSHLPPHMIPSMFIILDKLPLNANGKTDRKLLPSPDFTVVGNADYTDLVLLTPLEEHLCRIFSVAFHNKSPNIRLSFGSMGGTSLDAMRAVSLIRQEICAKIDISLLFNNPSVQQLARAIEPLIDFIEDISNSSVTIQLEDNHHQLMPSLCIEAVGIIILACQWIFPIWITYQSVPLLLLCVSVPLLHLLSYVSFRRLLFIVQNDTNKVDDVYSWYYYRWWFLNTLWKSNCSYWLSYLLGTPFYNFYLRLCGAQIGHHTHIYTTWIDAPWLLEVGDSTFIGEEVIFSSLSYQDQTYKLHQISIGSKCSINVRSVLYDNVIIQDNIYIESMSAITGHISTSTHYTSIEDQFVFSWGHIMCQLISLFCLYFIHSLLLYSTYYVYSFCSTLWLTPTMSLTFSWFFWILSSYLALVLLLKFICSDVKPGHYPLNSYYYIQKVWLRSLIISSFQYSLSIVPPNCTFPSTILRWLNVHVQDDVYIRDFQLVLRFPSNLLELGRGVSTHGNVMFASFAMSDEGQCYIDEICLGSDTELGNFCLILPGTRLPSKTYVGVLSRVTSENNCSETDVILLGIPSRKMPFTMPPNISIKNDRSSSNPSSFHSLVFICLNCLINKFLVIILYSSLSVTTALVTHTIAFCGLYRLSLFSHTNHIRSTFVEPIARVQELFDSLNADFFTFIGPLLTGTQYLVFLFRALGAQIGRDVILPDIGCLSQPHLVTIGDHVRLNMRAWIQVI